MYYDNETIIYLNGHYTKAAESGPGLFSQTLHYGYGVFEGIRSYKTESGAAIFKAKEHFERLQHSCKLMHIPFEYSIEELIDSSYQVLHQNKLEDAYLRPLVFLNDNMSLSLPTGVNVLIAAWSWGAYLGDKLLRLCLSPYQRPNPQSIHVEAKTCGHYVNSILATIDAKEKGFDEALLLDAKHFVAEGPGANLFMQKEGKLYTPKLGNILPGITRATVLELCNNLNIECEERLFTEAELKSADSAFYCGTAAEIIGIESIDDYHFPMKWEDTLGKLLQERYSLLVRGN